MVKLEVLNHRIGMNLQGILGQQIPAAFFLSMRVSPVFFGYGRETKTFERREEKVRPQVLRRAWKERGPCPSQDTTMKETE